jgi:hypothetical protein
MTTDFELILFELENVITVNAYITIEINVKGCHFNFGQALNMKSFDTIDPKTKKNLIFYICL